MEIRSSHGKHDRRIRLPGTVNLRDVGGYPVASSGGAGGGGASSGGAGGGGAGRGGAGGGGAGRGGAGGKAAAGKEAAGGGTVRWRTLLRSDALHRLDDSGRAALSALGLRTVVDLRTDEEVKAAPSALDDAGMQTFHVPVFDAAAIGRLPPELAAVYRHMIDDCGAAIAAAIGHLCGDGALPGLVHCTAGKDRTGLVVALVLEVVGVPDEVIAADYALSDAYLDAGTARAISRIRAIGGLGRWLDLGALGASPQVIHDALARVRSRSGSVRAYLIGNGLTARDLGHLRTALVTWRP
jgi:protein-tyrosine phosphatase